MEMNDFTPSSTSPDWASITAPNYDDPFMATGGGHDYEIPTCTFETCGFNGSFFDYRPTKSTNLAFAVLFGISALAFLIQGTASKKRWLGFTFAMVLGCVTEVVGYVGRVKAYDDLYSEVPFLIQIICLTIGPAFLAAGIYLCLSRIVTTFGPENSRIRPSWYPRIFITCDVLSLALQAAGGGIASVKTHQREDPELGNNIMIAGLSVQVVTLLIFILFALDFAIRTFRRIRQLGSQNALDSRHANLRKSWVFKGFLIALTISTLSIFTRCVYRVAELSDGWSGHLMKVQHYFVGLEGAIIVVAVYLLNLFHPGLCFKEASQVPTGLQEAEGWTWYGRKRGSDSEQSNQGAFELKAQQEAENMGGNGSRMPGLV